jgi:hypothetical protein
VWIDSHDFSTGLHKRQNTSVTINNVWMFFKLMNADKSSKASNFLHDINAIMAESGQIKYNVETIGLEG